VDFSGLKLKVIGAIVAISAIDLLKTFMEIPAHPTEVSSEMFLWKVTIHMAFVLSGVLFALMDRISLRRHQIALGIKSTKPAYLDSFFYTIPLISSD
jgi:uncharacterized protein (TIGR00645 family)